MERAREKGGGGIEKSFLGDDFSEAVSGLGSGEIVDRAMRR